VTRGALGSAIVRRWLVWVTVAIVGLAAFAVYRLQGAFGPQDPATPAGVAGQIVSYNPKRVQLEVFGDPGATATITYTDVDSLPQRVDDAVLPWSYDGSTTTPAVLLNLQAQTTGNTVGCRITVDGVVKVERSMSMPTAYVFCLDKSG
jgi:hypothetical protein